MQKHLFFLLLIYSVSVKCAASSSGCCERKFTYSPQGKISGIFVLAFNDSRATQPEHGSCRDGCVYVR